MYIFNQDRFTASISILIAFATGRKLVKTLLVNFYSSIPTFGVYFTVTVLIEIVHLLHVVSSVSFLYHSFQVQTMNINLHL